MLRDEIMEKIKPVPQKRIVEKMNEYMSKRDYAGAERHLLYWLAEAELGHDLQGMLMLRNEMVGHYRKTAQRQKALESAEKALEILAELDMEDTISAGTTYVNIATACNAFGELERSMELFGKARAVYEGSSFVEPQLLGGLYNNMALTCSALGRYEEALALYEKAADVMAEVQDGELEQAITFLNMADTVEAQMGPEEGENRIFGLLERAEKLLDEKGRELLLDPDAAEGPGKGSAGEKTNAAAGPGEAQEAKGSAGKSSNAAAGPGESQEVKDPAGKSSDAAEGPGKGSLLETPGALKALSREDRARIGYYAFVCEKCASVFEYYGYFLTAESLRERAQKIYAEER